MLVCVGTWIVNVTVVSPPPAAIVCGENVAVAPVGKPVTAKLTVDGNVLPPTGATSIL